MKRLKRKRAATKKTSRRNSAAATTRAVVGAARIASATLQRINRKWASYYRVLQDLRERLLEEQNDQLKQAAEPLERHSLSLADSATDEFDHNLALSRVSARH